MVQNVVVPVPNKNTDIYAVFAMLQDVFLHAKKTLYFRMVFAFPRAPKNKRLVKNGAKTVQNRFPKASYDSSIFFPGPGPQ